MSPPSPASPFPWTRAPGDKVAAAAINRSGSFTFEASRVGEDTTLAQMIRLVEEASSSQAPISKLADKVAGVPSRWSWPSPLSLPWSGSWPAATTSPVPSPPGWRCWSFPVPAPWVWPPLWPSWWARARERRTVS